MHECFLDNRVGGIASDIPDQHTASFAGIYINIVDAGTRLTHQTKPWCGVQQPVIHFYLIDNQNITIRDPGNGLLRSGVRPSHKLTLTLNRSQR